MRISDWSSDVCSSDLADFSAPPPMAGLGQRALQWVREQSAERIKLVRWFQALMPRQGRFFEQFEAHGQTLVDGADALARLLQGGPDIAEYCRQRQAHEHKADDIIRAVLQDVRWK